MAPKKKPRRKGPAPPRAGDFTPGLDDRTERRLSPGRHLSRTEFCLERAIKAGQVSVELAKSLRAALDRRALAHHSMGHVDAHFAELLDARIANADEWRRKYEIQAVMSARAMMQARADENGTFSGARKAVVAAHMRGRAIAGDWFGRWAEGMSRMRTRNVGFTQDVALIRNVLRELHGASSGDADAAGFAKVFREIADEALERFNRAGGSIRRLNDWASPQTHSFRRITLAGADEWIGDTLALVDPSKMLDDAGDPLDPQRLPEFLLGVYKHIATGQLDELGGPGAIGGRHRDPRVLKFRNADAWLQYQEKYGDPDLFNALTGHIERMATEIGIMETLGPIPDDAVRMMRSAVVEDAALAPLTTAQKAIRRLGYTVEPGKMRAWHVENLWNVTSGHASRPGSVLSAQINDGVRHLLMSVQLGSATISSVSDLATIAVTAKWNGLPASRVLGRMFELMKPGSEEARTFAVRLGLGAQSWQSKFYAGSRFSEEAAGPGLWHRMSDAVVRVSGLSAWTDAGRWAFGMEFMGMLGDHTGRALRDLEASGDSALEALARSMRSAGITDADWDAVRALPTEGFAGARYVTLEKLRESGIDAELRDDITAKFLTLVQSEMDFAVPTPSVEARSLITLGKRPGTVAGELLRAAGMYRSFPVTMVLSHLARGMNLTNFRHRGQYLASLFIGTTVMGALAYQGKNVVKGRDPLDMTEPEFWGAAMLQGGGLGIFGDFLAAGTGGRNRYGNTFLATLGGPMATFGQDVAEAFSPSDLFDQASRERAVRDRADALLRYVPGSSLWYTRVAFERLVADQVQQLVDPAAARQRWSRSDRYWREQVGTETWWRHGDLVPNRAPDMTNVFGGR